MSQDNKVQVGRLEDDISRTRQSLGRDIEALADKLSPERYRNIFKTQTEQTLANAQEVVMDTVHEVTDNVVERTQEAGASFFDMVRRHPLPTALLGAGVLLLVAGGGVGVKRANEDDEGYTGYGTRYGYGEGDYTGYVRPGYGDASAATGYTQPQSGYQTRGLSGQGYEGYGAYDDGSMGSSSGFSTGSSSMGGSNMGGSSTGNSNTGGSGAGDWLQSEGDDLRDRAGSAARQTKAKTRDAERGLAGFVESQPLIAGLITAILGALIGLSLPSTRQEDKLMGDARDQLADHAKETADRARQVAQKTFDDAKETAKQEFGQVADDAKAKGKNLVEEGKDAAKKVADDAKETAENESDKQTPS